LLIHFVILPTMGLGDETGPDEGPQQKHKNQTTNHLEISIAPL